MTGPGAEAFASLPFVPSSKDGDEGKPFVPAAAPQEKPPITEEEAAFIGAAVAAYFELGTMAMLAKHPEMVTDLSKLFDVKAALEKFPTAKAFVAGCASRTAVKYNIRIKYVDEGVTIGAIGFATVGLFGKPSKKAENDNRVAAAKDANPVTRDTAPPAAAKRDIPRDKESDYEREESRTEPIQPVTEEPFAL